MPKIYQRRSGPSRLLRSSIQSLRGRLPWDRSTMRRRERGGRGGASRPQDPPSSNEARSRAGQPCLLQPGTIRQALGREQLELAHRGATAAAPQSSLRPTRVCQLQLPVCLVEQTRIIHPTLTFEKKKSSASYYPNYCFGEHGFLSESAQRRRNRNDVTAFKIECSMCAAYCPPPCFRHVY